MPLEVALSNPDPDEFTRVVAQAVSKKMFILIMGLFRVEYKGRASSKLGYGERIAIIKADGSLVIHQPFGGRPVNWQPPGGLVKVSREGGLVVVSVFRRRPREVVKMHFSKVYLVAIAHLEDKERLVMYASEEDVRRAILAKPDLVEKGLRVIDIEVVLGNAGKVDVMGEDGEGNLVLIEVKNERAGIEAAKQLYRYVKYAKRHFKRGVRGILVAPEVSKGVLTFLKRNGLEYIELTPRRAFRELDKGLLSWI